MASGAATAAAPGVPSRLNPAAKRPNLFLDAVALARPAGAAYNRLVQTPTACGER